MLPLDRDGFPQLPAGKAGAATTLVNGLNHMTTRGMPLSMLFFQLGIQLGSMTGPNSSAQGRIVDKTGLTGKYDFHLVFASGRSWRYRSKRRARYRRGDGKTTWVETDERHSPVRRARNRSRRKNADRELGRLTGDKIACPTYQRAGSGAVSRLRFLRLRLRASAAFTRFFSPGFR